MNKKLFITGVKHCGKSTIGKSLSKELNIPFFDLDDLIEDSVKMGVRDFFKQEGRERFQEEELKAIENLLSSRYDSFICSTGGGICDNKEAYSSITNSGYTVFINEEFKTIYDRVIKGGVPAFIKGDDPEAEFRSIYDRRTQLYKDSAKICINANQRPPEEITDELKKELTSVWK